MTIVTLLSGCGNAYPGDGARDWRRAWRAMGERISVSRDLLITTL